VHEHLDDTLAPPDGVHRVLRTHAVAGMPSDERANTSGSMS